MRVAPSHWLDSGLNMRARVMRRGAWEIMGFWRKAAVIGLGLGLGPLALATGAAAQTNIDQGKSPAEIFSADCATCHKTIRGLAAGQNSLSLSTFLREHYTASRDQAAALAAYVLGNGGGQAASRGKPEPERATAKGEEQRSAEPKNGRPVRAAARPAEEPKAEERVPAANAERHEVRPEAKPEGRAEAKPDERPAAAPERRDGGKPVTASREKKEPVEAAPTPEPAPAVAAPAAATHASEPRTPVAAAPPPESAPAGGAQAASPELPGIGPVTNAAPADTSPSEPVPRDNIPD